MKQYLVYLAGPITGCSYGECTSWRQGVIKALPPHIIGLSPLRQKEYLGMETAIMDQYPDTVMSCQRGIMTRDRWDATRADAVFVNLLGATRVSIGTVMEIAWADAKRIPIVLVMEKTGNVHEHAMLRDAVGFRVETIDEGVNVLKALFYNGENVPPLFQFPMGKPAGDWMITPMPVEPIEYVIGDPPPGQEVKIT